MGDPFRNDLQAAHEKLAKQDEKIALLEAEKAALARGAPLPWNTGTVLAVTAPVVVALLMVLGGVVWLVAKRSDPPPPAPPIVIVETAVPPPPLQVDVPPAPVPPPRPVGHDDLKLAAAKTLLAVDMPACYTDATKITTYHLLVTFAPNGRPSVVEADQPGALTSDEQTCVMRKVREQAAIEPFPGPPVRVGKTFMTKHPTPPGNTY